MPWKALVLTVPATFMSARQRTGAALRCGCRSRQVPCDRQVRKASVGWFPCGSAPKRRSAREKCRSSLVDDIKDQAVLIVPPCGSCFSSACLSPFPPTTRTASIPCPLIGGMSGKIRWPAGPRRRSCPAGGLVRQPLDPIRRGGTMEQVSKPGSEQKSPP